VFRSLSLTWLEFPIDAKQVLEYLITVMRIEGAVNNPNANQTGGKNGPTLEDGFRGYPDEAGTI
jgi:hypothetical protein